MPLLEAHPHFRAHTNLTADTVRFSFLKHAQKSYFPSSAVGSMACNLPTPKSTSGQSPHGCRCIIHASRLYAIFLRTVMIWGDSLPIRLTLLSESLGNYNQMCYFPHCKKCQVTCREAEVLNKRPPWYIDPIEPTPRSTQRESTTEKQKLSREKYL